MPRKNAVKVGSFRPGTLRNLSSYDHMDFAVSRICKRYLENIAWQRRRINDTLRPLYGRDLNIQESELSSTIEKIKAIMSETGLEFHELAKEIRDYLGTNCRFYRNSNGKEVPVEASRLLAAHNAIKGGKTRAAVRVILYL